MNKEQLRDLAEVIALTAISENQDAITKSLAQHLDWNEGWEKTISQAAFNAVKTSTSLSVQIMLDILLQTGLFKISDEITRPHLELIEGGAPRE